MWTLEFAGWKICRKTWKGIAKQRDLLTARGWNVVIGFEADHGK